MQAAEGTGLAFIVFTQAIVELPGSNFWSVCFFMMLLALGLGSQFGTMEGVITNLFDMKVFARIRKEIVTGKSSSGCRSSILTIFDVHLRLVLILVIRVVHFFKYQEKEDEKKSLFTFSYYYIFF